MFSETDLFKEVTGQIETCLSEGRSVHASWLTHAVVGAHPKVEGNDKDFYTLCAYGYVRDAVRHALRRYKPDAEETPDPNIVLPGFERLQKGYLVEREKESVLVPTYQLSDGEIEAKATEYERMAEGCRLHAAELRRYKNKRAAA